MIHSQILLENQRVVPGCFSVSLEECGIVVIDWHESISEIQKFDLVLIKNIICDLSGGRRVPVYISTFPFLNISSEARAYSASDEGQEFTLANAVLVDNLAKKMMFNFFMRINCPKTPTRAFSSKTEAFVWLKTFL